jgi:uncharacterized membrane protein
MSPTARIVLLWFAFAGTHVGLSSVRFRPRLVARLGENGFRVLYSLVALAIFIPLVQTYFGHKHAGPLLWALPHTALLRWVVYVGMGLAFVLAVGGLVRPSPAAVVPGPPTPAGVYRVTRHPLMMAIAIFGLFHLLPNGSAADVAFFGGLAAFAVVGAAHQDRRKLATDPGGFRAFYEATSFFPFTRRSSVRGLRDVSPAVAALGLAITVIVRWFHASWFGG